MNTGSTRTRPLAVVTGASSGIGFELEGQFAEHGYDLNLRSTVHLAKRVASDVVKQGDGKILFTSSIASALPGTYQAVYNASKSFVQSFALALRAELKDTGVTVTSLMPGPTETEFFERADVPGSAKED